MGSSMGGRDLEFGVATLKPNCGQKRCRDMDLMSLHGRQCGRSRNGFDDETWATEWEVATWILCRDMG